jgi:hypothetical protein
MLKFRSLEFICFLKFEICNFNFFYAAYLIDML